MRCLGIDYGEKRIGLAWGDDLGVATPLRAATDATPEERLDRIHQLIRERKVTDIVVGYPYNMDGTVGFKAAEVDAFIAELESRFGLPVHRVDERLSSHAAQQSLGWNGRREREMRRTGLLDSAAAALILQDWLEQKVPIGDIFMEEEEEA
ncbi:MAG: putative Holliday junction resolvase [Verrucomicrobiota bacterium]|jgi:putative Holliday junction resolvase